MDGIKGLFDSFRVEEAYSWRDDIMEITRLIVHETDEARLNNIAEHFKVDLSEIREFLETKRKRMGKPMINADCVRQMSADALAALCAAPCPPDQTCGRNVVAPLPECEVCWRRWLESEVDNGT